MPKRILKRCACWLRGHMMVNIIEFYDEVHCTTTNKCVRCGWVSSSWTYAIGSKGYEKLVDLRRDFFSEDE